MFPVILELTICLVYATEEKLLLLQILTIDKFLLLLTKKLIIQALSLDIFISKSCKLKLFEDGHDLEFLHSGFEHQTTQ